MTDIHLGKLISPGLSSDWWMILVYQLIKPERSMFPCLTVYFVSCPILDVYCFIFDLKFGVFVAWGIYINVCEYCATYLRHFVVFKSEMILCFTDFSPTGQLAFNHSKFRPQISTHRIYWTWYNLSTFTIQKSTKCRKLYLFSFTNHHLSTVCCADALSYHLDRHRGENRSLGRRLDHGMLDIWNTLKGYKKWSSRISVVCTPLKTNMPPENQWLEDVLPSEIVPF